MNYVTSKDYEKLWELVQEGKKIPCLYQDDGIQRAGLAQKICGTPTPPGGGFCPNKEIFIQSCEADQVEMLLPDAWIKIESDNDLPPKGDYCVLVYRPKDNDYEVVHVNYFYSPCAAPKKFFQVTGVTHYKPLPEAPRE